MSIIDSHWTDAKISAFCQANMNELVGKIGLTDHIEIVAESFFLNPQYLGCTKDPSSMKVGIRRKLLDILPPEVVASLADDFVLVFQGFADLAYRQDNKFFIVLSRPNDSSTLSERVSQHTKIKIEDLAIGVNETSCGFDNLDLIGRIYQLFNSLPNGGVKHLMQTGEFGLIQYRSMLGAKRLFMHRGGDAKTMSIHEATAHIGAFTNAKISHEYLGFMVDFGLREGTINLAYRKIFDQLVDLKCTTKTSMGNYAEYAPVPTYSLLLGMNELLDEYQNQITAEHGKKFRAFHAAILSVDVKDHEREVIYDLTPTEFLECTEHFIVFQTLKGLKTLMGENSHKYVPQRGRSSFDRINAVLNY